MNTATDSNMFMRLSDRKALNSVSGKTNNGEHVPMLCYAMHCHLENGAAELSTTSTCILLD